ncbi:hypothetical protein KI387_037296, partial [Taxus chinensis]
AEKTHGPGDYSGLVMADNRRYVLTPQLDIGQILLEAQHRWLRPTEVCEILRNFKKFRLAPDPPHKPTGGSLFLFDRKALRYFRKDGLNWRKKKDGKTVREAHERLKAGSVDVLHCYYAHGEDNENFQRRCYWMLDEHYEHIVLVHYREVKEGSKAGAPRSINTERGAQTVNSAGHTTSYSNQAHTSSLLAQTTYGSSASTSEWNGQTPSSDFEEGESGDDVGATLSVDGEASSADQESILRQLNESEEFAVDSRGYLPQAYLKPIANLPSDKMNYSPLSASEVGHEQYSFLGLRQPLQGHFSKQIDDSQLGIPFQNASLGPYRNRENSSLAIGQGDYSGRQIFSPISTSGSNDLSMETKNLVIGGSRITNGHENNPSTWTDGFELGKASYPEETKAPCLQSMTREDILRRQTNIAMETFVSSELGVGQETYTDAHLQALARADLQINAEQIGSHRFMQNTPPSIVDKQQMAGLGYGSLNVQQQKNGILRDVDLFQDPSHQPNNQQRKYQTQNDGNNHLFQNEYLAKQEAEDDKKSLENSLYPQIRTQFSQESSFEVEGQEGLKKMDSFGRWMSREIGGDGEDSLVASDSGMYWSTLDSQNGVEEVSSFSRQIQLDADLMSPSLSQDQLFSISDFSPDWAYSEVDTKVLITGTFMGGVKDIYKYKLSCMFGEIEVSADVLVPGVLRCQAPPHSAGRVPFYVTCSNRLACSEVREFEYRAVPSQEMINSSNMDNEAQDELTLQIQFAKLLCLNFDKAQIPSSVSEDGSYSMQNKLRSLMKDSEEEWLEMERSIKASTPDFAKTRTWLMQKLLKEKLYAWLLWKTNEEGKGPNVLDDQGKGAIHLAAALDYDWAMAPIVSSGVNINFRDLHGWTALHWAAFYGREQTVSALVNLEAAPGALTDPTPEFVAGRTPADLASCRGHKGIAGYLAESSLTNHLSNLSINENIMGSVSATLAGEKAVETVAERNVLQLDEGDREDQLSLKDSLAAVRNAAQAAARIQGAFRVHSFRRRQTVKYGDDKCGMSEEKALSFISVQRASRLGNHDEPLHTAAIRIQRKYRGWKGRKEFLIIRQRIVKIQAHVRGHQVRKNYKKVVWSVGIVEKAILRWRRKRVGLRGFRAEGAIECSDKQNSESDDYDFLRAGRKQMEAGVEKALARVQSMVQYPEARDQYRRLLANSQETKVDTGGTSNWGSQNTSKCKINEEDQDVLMSMPD